MPSSGYGIEDVDKAQTMYFEQCYQIAKGHQMVAEWLGSLISALRKGADIREASNAGLIEWDM